MQRQVDVWWLFEHMVESEINTVATAIRGAEFEGFVAGTLFSQGWNVSYRALDIASLLHYIDNANEKISLLLISTDVEGFDRQTLEVVRSRGIKLFLFASSPAESEIYPESIPQPHTPLELLGLIRGSLRVPMIRAGYKENARARTIAITSPTTSSGCTTLTINLGAELAQLGHKVLIVDAHAFLPAFAIRLQERGLNISHELRCISPQLWALEVTREDIAASISALDRARLEFDFIVIDHGTICDFPAILTGQRWSSETFLWSATHADEHWVLCKTDLLSLERLKSFMSELARNSIKPELTFIQNTGGNTKAKKAESESFLQLITPSRPSRILQYPWDPRSVQAAEEHCSALLDVSERGILRKSIAQFAGEVSS